MTATERLRALLDERGVDYRVSATGYSIDIGPYTTAYANRSDTTLDVSLRQVTPEQAIAATLGATDARPTQVESSETCRFEWSLARNGWADHTCSECGYRENTDIHVSLGWHFCPNCGRRIVEVDG